MNYDDIYIFTTDTVTGIGCKIDSKSLEKLYQLKKRPIDKKIMILAGRVEDILNCDNFDEKQKCFIAEFNKKYWPGQYSLIINDQGYRIPNNKRLIDFLITNGPLYATSANISGQKPIQITEAKKIFPEVKNVYDFGKVTNKPSDIYNYDIDEWIIRKG
ncbi:Sua5/YciO/YrdC/YwlC family protein [Mycoplasmopsis ciconiae]|uniref:L-threonylcarbamoyladenylate synthase n=1 Tax=Mycoplasmopsis ciconiae TaxID=561067 RepID=A0ABU7MMT5_9BACT|nr:Sua5/YciO/YrdC/YwlC family protein [Mycoplasmopsis ciconiae]